MFDPRKFYNAKVSNGMDKPTALQLTVDRTKVEGVSGSLTLAAQQVFDSQTQSGASPSAAAQATVASVLGVTTVAEEERTAADRVEDAAGYVELGAGMLDDLMSLANGGGGGAPAPQGDAGLDALRRELAGIDLEADDTGSGGGGGGEVVDTYSQRQASQAIDEVLGKSVEVPKEVKAITDIVRRQGPAVLEAVLTNIPVIRRLAQSVNLLPRAQKAAECQCVYKMLPKSHREALAAVKCGLSPGLLSSQAAKDAYLAIVLAGQDYTVMDGDTGPGTCHFC